MNAIKVMALFLYICMVLELDSSRYDGFIPMLSPYSFTSLWGKMTIFFCYNIPKKMKKNNQN